MTREEAIKEAERIQARIADAIEAAYKRGKDDAGVATVNALSNPTKLLVEAALIHGIVDMTSGEPIVRAMCPKADGTPSTLPVTADGAVFGIGAFVWHEVCWPRGEVHGHGHTDMTRAELKAAKTCYSTKAAAEAARKDATT